MRVWKFLLSSTALSRIAGGLVLISGSAALAADLEPLVTKAPVLGQPSGQPAVDGLNFKAEGMGGSIENHTVYGSQAAVSIPIGRQFGLQLDGALGDFDNRFFGSGAAHAFWRDPSIGLAGFYTSHTFWERFGGVHVGRYGTEGALYLNRWTLEGVVGVEAGSNKSETIGNIISTLTIKTRFFDQISASYYLQDNLKVSIGQAVAAGRDALTLGGEWGIPMGGGDMAALFVEARAGTGNYHGVWGGVRFYFGNHDKTLIRRNREDDPPADQNGNLFTLGGSLGQQGVPPPPPPKHTCPPGETFINGICVFTGT
jgi:hypothetical protein